VLTAVPGGKATLQAGNTSCAEALCICLVVCAYFVQLLFMGAFLGSGLFGFLCDSRGRRKPMFMATSLVAVTMLAGIAAPSYWVMATLRLVAVVGGAGQTHTAALLSLEPEGPDYRCAVLCCCVLWCCLL
jgi:MFS family permease